MKRMWMFLFLIAVSATLSAQSVLECVADTHLDRRGSYLNGDSAVVDNDVWEWEIGSGNTYNNVQGVTAAGLVYATSSTGNPAYAAATLPTANLIIGRYNDAPTLRPYSTDVDFLVDVCGFDPGDYFLTEAVNNSAYCTKATELYGRVVGDFPNPAANVDRYIDISQRGSLSGWDVSGHIRAAYRSGYHSYALGMMERLLERRPDWEHVIYSGWDFTTISHAGIIRSIFEMYSAGDIDTATYDEGVLMAEGLVSNQEPSTGDWENDAQTTAFAILGLRSDTTDMVEWRSALVLAENFLQDTATGPTECGWNYPPEYGEVNSEAMMALAVMNSLPFVDGFETEDTSAWTLAEGVEPFAPRISEVRLASSPRPVPLR